MATQMIIDDRLEGNGYMMLAGMRPLLAVVTCAVAAFAADASTAVRESSAAWRQAVIKQDKAALERWLADDLVYAHSSGKTETKAEYIAAVTKGPARYESFTSSNSVIRVYGTAAILEEHVDVKLAGRDAYRVRTLEVYVVQDGRWRMTAHQSARLSP